MPARSSSTSPKICAFGARSDAEAYQEMEARIATAPQTLHAKALADVLATLGRLTDDIEATPEPATPEPPPKWLRESLLYVVRLPAEEVEAMDRAAAGQVWSDYTTGKGR